MDGHVQSALGLAQRVSPGGSRNLIAPDESYLNVLQKIIRPARGILHAHNLKSFYELRAAYACERYEQISYELGHGRIDVVAAYIGGRI